MGLFCDVREDVSWKLGGCLKVGAGFVAGTEPAMGGL